MTTLSRPTSLAALAAPALAALFASGAVRAHVTLPPGGATAGTTYAAAFHVGHACKGAASTTALTVRLPAGFQALSAPPHPGWTFARSAHEVSWTAATPQAALPGTAKDDFVIEGRLPALPATLWFKVLQTCDVGSADWAQVATGADKPEFPAARLDVLAPGVAPVDVRDAWARPMVAGQTSTAVYARLLAPSGSRLVGVSSPLAAEAGVHEMKMDGDVMRMRAVAGGLDLPPRAPVALAPSGLHIMLTGLQKPVAVGESIPLTLRFVDRAGKASALSVQVPVEAGPAGAPTAHVHAD